MGDKGEETKGGNIERAGGRGKNNIHRGKEEGRNKKGEKERETGEQMKSE